MIESAAGVLAVQAIASAEGCAGLFMGNNDLRQDLGIPPSAAREGLALSLQSVMLAARAAGIAAFDGVFNRLDDEAGFESECAAGHALGFARSEEHTSELQSLMRISYAVFYLKKKKT